jgi:hypothetical protein
MKQAIISLLVGAVIGGYVGHMHTKVDFYENKLGMFRDKITLRN